MENILLEEEKQIQVPELKVFRDFVDHLKCRKREEIYIKLSYLLAARASELLTKVTPYMLKHNMTKPYGKLLDWSFTDYKNADGKTVKILLVKSAIAKRMKPKREPQQTETNPQKAEQTTMTPQPLKVKTKIVPIVCDPAAEPWCVDILKWLANTKESKGKLSFDFTEMTAQNIVKRNLRDLNPDIHPHLLRHFRISHLIKNYDFSPYQITAFTGWSISSTFQKLNIQASSNLDIYSHLMWKDYIDKLLLPLEHVL